ncbi:MAG TPA: glycosyltransferase [Flavobacteriaceae bacterium]|nr:glycosyltransferase [Flavobacteriaceae bacterium]
MDWLDLLLYLFIAASSIKLLFYILFLKHFAWTKTLNPKQKNIGVSVIICAKNEARNINAFLPYIIRQDYPEFEIVLVNDNSHDNTLDVMENFALKHNNIKLVNVKNIEAFWANKKFALTLGIKAAKYDYLLFTDADCKPLSKHWIKNMSSHFSNEKTIVLGYGAYQKQRSFLNKLIRFETLLTALHYFSFAKLGMPYMGVGRNLAYRKDEFFKANGFLNHMHIRSGDDDLFINQVATKKNTAVCLTKDSFTLSIPNNTLKDWIKQKRRHYTTSGFYKQSHKFILSSLYLSNMLFWVLITVLLILKMHLKWLAVIFLLKCILQGFLIKKVSKKLNESDLFFLFPVLEICLLSLQLYIFINNLISKPKHWK